MLWPAQSKFLLRGNNVERLKSKILFTDNFYKRLLMVPVERNSEGNIRKIKAFYGYIKNICDEDLAFQDEY